MSFSWALNIWYLKMGPSAGKLSCFEPGLTEINRPFLTLLIPQTLYQGWRSWFSKASDLRPSFFSTTFNFKHVSKVLSLSETSLTFNYIWRCHHDTSQQAGVHKTHWKSLRTEGWAEMETAGFHLQVPSLALKGIFSISEQVARCLSSTTSMLIYYGWGSCLFYASLTIGAIKRGSPALSTLLWLQVPITCLAPVLGNMSLHSEPKKGLDLMENWPFFFTGQIFSWVTSLSCFSTQRS